MNLIILDNLFEYQFIQKGLIAIILMSVILPLIGLNVVTKKISMIGDTISHTSLCGIAIGLACGTLPIYMAIIASVIGGIIIEIIRNKFSKYAEISLSIVLSLSIGIAGIMANYAPGNKFESYLFGSLLTVTYQDIYILIGLFVIVLISFIAFYRTNLLIGFSPIEAKVEGLNVYLINIINMVIISTTIAICSTIIGSLLVSSIMIIPVACSLQVSKKYSSTCIISIIISLFTSFIGLIISYYLDINTSSTIVLLGVFILLLILIFKPIIKKIKR